MEQHRETATLIILGLPSTALCGIDLISFTSSPRFQGIKLIPQGWHFVYTGINDALSLRQGAWFYFSPAPDTPAEVLVRQYNKDIESLDAVGDESILLHWRSNLGSIWRESLTPYRASVTERTDKSEGDFVEESQDWNRLTDCLSASLLSRITGNGKTSNDWSLTSASSASRDADNIPGLQKDDFNERAEKDLGFLPIDLKRTWRLGAVGRERTDAAQDRSWALQNLVEEYCNDELDVIGEMQFTFIMVLTLNNNSCLEQWKRILGLLFTCKTAVVERPAFFSRFITMVKLQLEHCRDAENGLFDLSEDGAPFLKTLLKRFRTGLDQQDGIAKSDVMDDLEELEDFLKLDYGWGLNESQMKSGYVQLEDGEEVYLNMKGADEEDETGDWAPTVVGLTPEQAKALNLDEDSIVLPPSGESTLESDITRKLRDEEEDIDQEEEARSDLGAGLSSDQDEKDVNEEDDQDLEEIDARY